MLREPSIVCMPVQYPLGLINTLPVGLAGVSDEYIGKATPVVNAFGKSAGVSVFGQRLSGLLLVGSVG